MVVLKQNGFYFVYIYTQNQKIANFNWKTFNTEQSMTTTFNKAGVYHSNLYYTT